MAYLDTWRGFDIKSRCEKIENAMNRIPITSADQFPVMAQTPPYFGFGNNPMPKGYWDNPEVMVRYQENGYFKHLSKVNDDVIPYFMPWFGTGVLASAFGCKIKPATGNGDDPGVISTCINSLSDFSKLKLPNPEIDGYMPRVLKFMDYALKNSDLPVGLTDMNSPLCTALQMCGYENFCVWMYDEPEFVNELMDFICESYIAWVKIQKQHNGEPLDQSNGLQGVWSPKGIGTWMSDDDLVSISPHLYKEFIVPHYEKILETFSGASVHYCGNGTHQLDNLCNMKNIRVINNSPMGNYEAFALLAAKMKGKVAIQIQDQAPADYEEYYENLFSHVDSVNGMMLNTFVQDRVALQGKGGNTVVDWNALETAEKITIAVRKAVTNVLKRTGRQ